MQRPVEVSGAIFGCTDQTESECLSRKLFGLKGTSWSTVSQVVEGMPLWLYNFERKILRGVFYAAGPGTYNLNPLALQGNQVTGSAFPAQCSVTWNELSEPVPVKLLQQIVPQIFYRDNKFRFSLGPGEVRALLVVFRKNKQPAVSTHLQKPAAFVNPTAVRSQPPPLLPVPPVLPTDGIEQPPPRYQSARPQLTHARYESAPARYHSAQDRGRWLDPAAGPSHGLQAPYSYSSRRDKSSYLPPTVSSPPMPPVLPRSSLHDSGMTHPSRQHQRQPAYDRAADRDLAMRPQPMQAFPVQQGSRSQQAPQQRQQSPQSTVSIRNVPYGFSADALVDLLDGAGQLQEQYDFLLLTYLEELDSWWAIVNFTTQQAAQQAKAWLHQQLWANLLGMRGSGDGIAAVIAYETNGRAALQHVFGASSPAFYESPPREQHVEAEQPSFFYDNFAPDPAFRQQSMVLPPRSVSYAGGFADTHRSRVVSSSGGPQQGGRGRGRDVPRPQYRGESAQSQRPQAEPPLSRPQPHMQEHAASPRHAQSSRHEHAPQPRPVHSSRYEPAAQAKAASSSRPHAAQLPAKPGSRASAQRPPQPAAPVRQKRQRSPEHRSRPSASGGSKRKITPIVWGRSDGAQAQASDDFAAEAMPSKRPRQAAEPRRPRDRPAPAQHAAAAPMPHKQSAAAGQSLPSGAQQAAAPSSVRPISPSGSKQLQQRHGSPDAVEPIANGHAEPKPESEHPHPPQQPSVHMPHASIDAIMDSSEQQAPAPVQQREAQHRATADSSAPVPGSPPAEPLPAQPEQAEGSLCVSSIDSRSHAAAGADANVEMQEAPADLPASIQELTGAMLASNAAAAAGKPAADVHEVVTVIASGAEPSSFGEDFLALPS